MSRKRLRMEYEKAERNIRRVFYVYDDGAREPAGFEVRVGGKRMGMKPNITQARAARDKAQADLAKGALVAPSAGKVTVKVMADRWLNSTKATRWKPRTRAGYKGIVNNRLAPLHDVAVKDVTPAVVDTFIAGLIKEGLKPSTVRHVYHVLNQALRLAVRDRLIVANPCAEVERPSLTRNEVQVPEMATVEALLAHLSGLDHDRAEEWALYTELAAYAGLRAGEVCGLRVGHLDPLRGCLRVSETVTVISGKTSVGTPKSKASKRTVPLSSSLAARLSAHVHGRSRDAYVFGDGETPFRHGNFYRRVFRPAAKVVKAPGLRYHDLRHFYASLLLTNPALNAVDISKVLGHADANLLFNTYGHSFEKATDGVGDWLTALREASASASSPSPAVRSIKRKGTATG